MVRINLEFQTIDGEKKCRRCLKVKPVEEFCTILANFDKRNGKCKACEKELLKKRQFKRVVIIPDVKFCKGCKQEKSSVDFTRNSTNTKDGLATLCRVCDSFRRKQWIVDNPEKSKFTSWIRHLKKHGLTVDEYETILKSQGGVCASCGQEETKRYKNGQILRLSIDHNHEHDYAHEKNQKSCKECHRGLLCHYCNAAAGFVSDDIDVLRRIIHYLNST